MIFDRRCRLALTIENIYNVYGIYTEKPIFLFSLFFNIYGRLAIASDKPHLISLCCRSGQISVILFDFD